MSRGITLADFVQQVYYAVYKVRLNTGYSSDANGSYHAGTDKFKEVLMEVNLVQQELQQQMDWNWLRARLTLGTAEDLGEGRITEFILPEHVYKVCTGYNDAVRLHSPINPNMFLQVPFTSPRNGTVNNVAMFDGYGQLNTPDHRLMAFVVGDHLTFTRPFTRSDQGMIVETDVVELLEPVHPDPRSVLHGGTHSDEAGRGRPFGLGSCAVPER
jgi:hypothetical protein